MRTAAGELEGALERAGREFRRRPGRVEVRRVADDRDPLDAADLRPVVGRGVVLDGPVVPERDRVRLPPQAHLVLGVRRLAVQQLQQLGNSVPRRMGEAVGWSIRPVSNFLYEE